MQYQVVDNFYAKAKDLRRVFDKRFADPLLTHRDRFVWDFWHVPGEYTHLRTPAFHYFPKTQYEAFHRFLVKWGRENLGCHDISPPWLSNYVSGCRQEPHRDVPHGPLAFVYSLTQGHNKWFKGGETFIKPNVLIAPKFNRLTLFNPALLHGVREVKGTMDPRHGRLVVHGWFVQPRPFWVGPLTAEEVMESIEPGLQHLRFSARAQGLISLRLQIHPTGRVTNSTVLINTLGSGNQKHIVQLVQGLRGLRFPVKRSPTRLTLPLVVSP